MTDDAPQREPGWYWVRWKGSRWVPAGYDPQEQIWWQIGRDLAVGEHEIIEVGPRMRPPGEPAPKAEASDLERARQVVLDLTGHDPGEESAWGRVVATALAAVRREATSAERERCIKVLQKRAKIFDAAYGETSESALHGHAAHRDLAANKPRDITNARDPVALLLAEAARLQAIPYADTEYYTDHQERQRRARCYQDAAELLGSGK